MRFVKHNVIENFNQSTPKEKKVLIVEEMSKAYLLFPNAVAEVLDNNGIKYKSTHPEHLAEAVNKNSDNLKMLNRVIRLSFLVNQDGSVIRNNHQKTISFRDVMQKGSDFLKKHPKELKDATLIARDMMKENLYSKTLDKTMTNYLNMDGQEKISLSEGSGNNSAMYLLLGLVAIGFFAYYKTRGK
ncbi:hypothetical protein EBZ38_14185 [bacterium]|nr:hypothetical protein [Alphaproteobacteria bacterium]NDD85407.1 hypothetical protein [bacterium]